MNGAERALAKSADETDPVSGVEKSVFLLWVSRENISAVARGYGKHTRKQHMLEFLVFEY